MPGLDLALVSLHTSPFSVPGQGDVGGMNVVINELSRTLARQGHRITVYTRRTDSMSPDRLQIAENLTLEFIAAGPPTLLAKADQVAYIGDFGAALRQRMGERITPDLIHSHHWLSGVAALSVARELGTPHLQSYHSIAAAPGAGFFDGEPPEDPGRPDAERHLARESDGLIAVSTAEATTVTERLGANPDLVQVVPPGVNSSLFRPVDNPSAYERRWRQPYLLAAARLEPLKGIELAIETVAAIPPAHRPRLVIAGEATAGYDSYVAGLRQLPDLLGVTANVDFTGSLERAEFAALMRGAFALLVPSHSETFGLVALEAAASGVPTIGFSGGGLCEAICPDVSGVLLQSRDPGIWADSVITWLRDPDAWNSLGERAHEYASSRTWELTATGIVAAYLRLL